MTPCAMTRILSPAGQAAPGRRESAPPLGRVAGSRVGLRIQWPSFDVYLARLVELLVQRHGVAGTTTMFTGSDGTAAGRVTIRGRSDATRWAKAYDDFRAKTDWGIFGLAA